MTSVKVVCGADAPTSTQGFLWEKPERELPQAIGRHQRRVGQMSTVSPSADPYDGDEEASADSRALAL